MPYLLKDLEHESGIGLDFISDAVARFEDDDSIPGIFTMAMVDISAKLSTLTMNDDYKPYVNVCCPNHQDQYKVY